MTDNKARIRLIDVLAILAAVALVLIMLVPLVVNARAKSHRSTCQANMSKIASAIQEYSRDYNGHVPPVSRNPATSYTDPGAGGGPIWTGTLLKYLKGQDGSVFRCPLVDDEMVRYHHFYEPESPRWPLTTYGMNWRFSNGGALGGEPFHPKAMYAGLIQTLDAPPIPSRTVLLIETQNKPICTSMTRPAIMGKIVAGGNVAPFTDTGDYFWAVRWLDRKNFTPYGHEGGCNVILADGHADFVSTPASPYPPKLSQIESEGLTWW